MEILETKVGEVKLFINDGHGFKIFDFLNSTTEIITPLNTSPDLLGPPMKGIWLGKTFAMCYKSK